MSNAKPSYGNLRVQIYGCLKLSSYVVGELNKSPAMMLKWKK